MIEKIENYIMNIQKNNWGFPWHLFFANIGFHLCFPIFMFTKLNFARGIGWAIIVSVILINLIGYLNELRDKKRGGDRTEFWQDSIGNNIGILIGIAEWFYILKLFL